MHTKENPSSLSQCHNANPMVVQTLYELSQKSLFTAIVFTLLTSMALYSELGLDVVIWASMVLALSLARLHFARLFKAKQKKYSIILWYQIFAVLALATGLSVSTLGFVLIYDLNAYYQLFVLASLLGFTAGATISLSSDFKIAVLYISIIILPLIFSMARQDTALNVFIPIILVLFFFSQIAMIHKSYSQDKQVRDLMVINQNLLEENKQFIADMVHQIRTPLAVIMTNTSLIEMKTSTDVSTNVRQINSSIGMLNNAYEDLSYLLSHDRIVYKAIELNFTQFLQERLSFFENIAKDNNKSIKADLDASIIIHINDTELERVIDNNVANAIKYSDDGSVIQVILKSTQTAVVLRFVSVGKTIKDTKQLFDKNYTENNGAKRSLGLGLNMVKNICEKNDITYHVNSQNNLNTFTYVFKMGVL
jgi:signal transduction histidine kinase